MSRWLLPLGGVLWVGATLLLSQRRWFARRPLHERLAPYAPGGWRQGRRAGVLSVDTFVEVIGPLAAVIGEHLGRAVGVREDLATRLERIHSPHDAQTLRIRQLVTAGLVFVAAGGLLTLIHLPVAVELLVVLGGPALAFLVLEQQVAQASSRWQERLFLELPVVSEQIGMLLSAGYSLGTALDRIARRGSGACSRDLARVGRRIRQGLSEVDALQEWAELSDVPAVHRLVGVLALDRDAGDLGRLISDEARAIRREVQRQLTAQIDRRAQQVWIPVTVATLVPGTIFIAVPFLQAMRLFADG